MKDYSNIGLDNKLQKIGSIANKDRNWQGSYDFDATTDVSIISTKKVRSISADKLSAGTVVVAIDIGNGNISLDGENNRIIINDGTDDRVLLGYQSGGF